MSSQVACEHAIASLHEAALDDLLWPKAASLINEIVQTKASALACGSGRSQSDADLLFMRFCFGEQTREDLVKEYFNDHWHQDASIARICWLPHGQLVHTSDLFTADEKKTSSAYNVGRRDAQMQNGLNVRLDGPAGSNIVWILGDSAARDGFGSTDVRTISYLLPHLGQFVRVRQALADVGALGSSLSRLLENARCGVIQLDRKARIAAANDRASGILRQRDGLFDQRGFLSARTGPENDELQRLLARAMPRFGVQPVSGSMTLRRRSAGTRLVVHVNPVGDHQGGFRAQRVAALVLIVDPQSPARLDPRIVSAALGLTKTESRLAVMVATGHNVRDIASLTGRKESTVRWHLKQIFRKQPGVSSQAELVRRVLSMDGFPRSRR
ncbi:MAG: helix-turn-helix transcriptional regulator [Gemmatimonadota bacterium]|nr:helix-turn-helix transcriptional regulator [Gemmatimonadota bacterium]